MKSERCAILATVFVLLGGCAKENPVQSNHVSGRFVVDSVYVSVHPSSTSANFAFHFSQLPGDCNLCKVEVGNSGYVLIGGPALGFSPYPIDSMVHVTANFDINDTLAVGDSVWTVYQFRGEFWNTIGSTRVIYGDFTVRDSVRAVVEP
jgi:hypothetical protein